MPKPSYDFKAFVYRKWCTKVQDYAKYIRLR